jgi:hypothetical protein
MAFVRIIFRYNILFVFDSELDSKGLFYPQALLHIIVGLYMAEICMIGLFALKFAFGPMLLMLIFFVFTGLVHFSLSEAIAPLLQNLPQTLALEEQLQEEEKMAAEARKAAAAEDGNAGGAADYYDTEQAFGEEELSSPEDEEEVDHGPNPSTRAVEGASGMGSALKDFLKAATKSKVESEVEQSGLMKVLAKLGLVGGDEDSDEPPSFLKRWMHPEIYDDFIALRKMIPDSDLPEAEDANDHPLSNYWPPEVCLPKPTLWIPRDDARVSRQEVAHTKKMTPITDHGTSMDEKGLIIVDVEAAPFPRQRLVH